jgi:hypothetical protein
VLKLENDVALQQLLRNPTAIHIPGNATYIVGGG